LEEIKMKLNKMKRLAAVVGIAAMIAASLTACGDKKNSDSALNKDAVVLTVGDEQIKLSEAYFMVKWQEASYYNIFGYGYGDNWYEKDLFGSGMPFQDYIKDSCMTLLKRICVSRQKFDEMGLKLTDAEKSEIDKAVESYMESNNKDARAAMMADEEVVRTVLTDYKILEKVAAKTVEGVDTEVSDDELKEAAYTRTYDYVYSSFTTTDENGSSTLMSASQQEEQMNILNTIRSETISGTDFDEAVQNAGQSVASHTYTPGATEQEDNMYEINDYMDNLKIGDVSEVIPLDTTGAIVAYMREDNTDKLGDEEVLKSAKESVISKRKIELYKKSMKEWLGEVNIEIDEEEWGSVTMKEALKALSGNTK